MLRCSDKSYHVGRTDELDQRIAQHGSGLSSGYTATRLPVRLVWFAEFPTREEATAEAQLKKWSRRKKEALIEGKIQELKLAARKDWSAYRQRRSKP